MASVVVGVQETVRFGDGFEFDPVSRTLQRDDFPLRLERIPTEILAYLIERRGELVTREQIVERIWGEGVFLDTDNSINGAIRKIRRVLKDDPERPRYLQTITGKGYRFIAPLVDLAEARPATPAESQPASLPFSAREAGIGGFTGKPLPLLIALCSLLLFAVAIWGAWRSGSRSKPKGRVMLAVLPFVNLTGESDQDYFSDGFTEEMIIELGRLDPPHLGVIARTSVMYYKTGHKPFPEIAQELGVQYVLEGSVRRDAGKVRISAQLIQVGDQTHLWARDYDREVSGLLALQTEIAHEITDEIELTLVHDHVSAPEVHSIPAPGAYEAYDLYLKGRYFWNKRTPDGFRQAIVCFHQAIEKNPTDGRAYAGLADSYAMMSTYSLAAPSEVMPKARAAALKALEIDPSLAEAHTSLAVISENYDWDWQTAEKEFRRALQLNPNYSTAHQWYAEFLAFQGRFTEALAESERARQLDPLSLIIAADNGAILYFSRDYDRAIERFRSVLDMDPTLIRAHLIIAAYVEKGQFREALADIDQWRQRDDGPWISAWQAYVYGRAGDRRRARLALHHIEQVFHDKEDTFGSAFVMAYLGMSDVEHALAFLDKTCFEHCNAGATFKADPIYDPLRHEPRFQGLLHRVGLVQ